MPAFSRSQDPELTPGIRHPLAAGLAAFILGVERVDIVERHRAGEFGDPLGYG
jgi:hypothetical protein